MIIKAICFDADGVVVNPQMQFSQLLKDQYGISPQMTRDFFQGIFNDCLIGKADLKQVLPPYLREWGWEDTVDDFIHLWLTTDHVIDQRLIKAIQDLRRIGLLCCLTTSQERNRAGYMKTVMGFRSIFDDLFFSCEIGCQKPDLEYYRHIQKMLSLDADSILFWDDNPVNVEAARLCGWCAEVYSGFEDFQKTLTSYIQA